MPYMGVMGVRVCPRLSASVRVVRVCPRCPRVLDQAIGHQPAFANLRTFLAPEAMDEVRSLKMGLEDRGEG